MSDSAVSPLHVAFYSDATVLGGAEQALGLLLTHLAPQVRVTLIGVDEAVVRWLAESRPSTSSLVLSPVRNKGDLGRMWAHRRAIVGVRPDVFQANLNSVNSCQYPLAVALTVPDVRVVALEHSPLAGESRGSLALKRAVARGLAAHVSVGEAVSRAVEHLANLPAGSVRTIHNAVADFSVRTVDLRRDRPVVGSIGRLEWLKGYDVLLRATAPLDVDVVIVGEGPARGELVELAERLGMTGRLRLLGWQERPRDLLSGIDIFALPSRLEGLPLVVLEAMLARLPVVATRVGSVGEAVGPTSGFVVDPDDVTGMSNAITTLLADPTRARRMGDSGRARALGDFAPPRMAAAWEALYAEITADVARP